MQQEIAREPSSGNAELQVSRVPFSLLGNQSRLFLEYQDDPLSIRRFYPNAVETPSRIDPFVETVLANYKTDRQRLCDILASYNLSIDASETSLENIRVLREANTVAVVTGQQAGLFTGPLYTIYKALSAIKMAESLSARGIKAVPVFWVASEDHDFQEVSETSFIDASGSLKHLKYVPEGYVEGMPVGLVEVDDSVKSKINQLVDSLPRSVFTSEIRDLLRSAWNDGSLFSSGFARTLAKTLSAFGMIFIDPLEPAIKTLAAPVYEMAAASANEIVTSVINRGRELVNEGYHTQVEVRRDYFPLFWHDDAGVRRALRKSCDGVYRINGESREFLLTELTHIARTEPQRFSPGVMLRPVVQDYLLPTVCYFGGGAEIAYFAQNSEVYRVLGRPVTPIFHRQSFTVIEARHRKTLEKYDLTLPVLFAGLEDVLLKIAAKTISPDSARIFAEVEENINSQLHQLDQRLSIIDPTLAESLVKRRRKILYHVGALRKKALLAEVRQHETAHRQIDNLFATLLPNGELQERSINVFSFVNKFGDGFLNWIYASIDLEDKQHRVVYL